MAELTERVVRRGPAGRVFMQPSTRPAAQPLVQPPGSGGFVSGSTQGHPSGAAPAAGAGAASAAGGGSSVPSLSLTANTNQALEALRSRYGKHLDNLENDTGQIMDTAGSRIRDAREGGRRALQENSMFRGAASDPALSSYESETTGLVAKGIADTAAQREANLTGALQGGVSVMGAPEEQALREKGLGVSAYTAEQNARAAANNTAFNQYLALLNATRSSPIYTG